MGGGRESEEAAGAGESLRVSFMLLAQSAKCRGFGGGASKENGGLCAKYRMLTPASRFMQTAQSSVQFGLSLHAGQGPDGVVSLDDSERLTT